MAFPYSRYRRGEPVARVAFNMRPLDRPWGGGNWWLTQIVGHLRKQGYDVRFDLKRDPDCIVVVDPRVGGNVVFGHKEIARHKARHRGVRCLHRINEGDMHRGTPMMDEPLAEVNEVADHTIFISEWIRDYHAKRWFDRSRPHSVILNGANPTIFNAAGSEELPESGPMRLVTHHWSNNPRKGFDVYAEVDRLIAEGQLDGVELWVIGRWPDGIEWRAARTFEPVAGPELAALLRQGHVYLTASRFEAGAMHFIEGVQCGLPLIYHDDGGGIVELGRRYGIGFRDDIAAAITTMRDRYPEFRRAVLADPPSGDTMCRSYQAAIDNFLARPEPTTAIPPTRAHGHSARRPQEVRRLAAALALIAAIAWCCLLFGVGLDDLTDQHTQPGVIFSIVILPLCIIAATYGLWRTIWSGSQGPGSPPLRARFRRWDS